MNRKYKNVFLALCAAICLSGLTSCGNEDMETYDNKGFITSEPVGSILLKGTNDTETKIIETKIAKPETEDISVSYQADMSLVNQYNAIYGDTAIALPLDNYEIPDNKSTIVAGALQGNNVEIHFKNLSVLDREKVYVLPVSVSSSNIEMLRSARTTYYVVRGAALINTVANLTKNNLSLASPTTSTLTGLKQITIEALVRIDKFGKLISTVMGIEGSFLFRIGDAGVPDNQLQLATSSGNVTDAAWQLPTGVWTHLAATWDSSTGAVEVYINGIKKGATQISPYRGTVNWASSNFYIGKSYDDNRWLEGDICECRIWNKILSADEINAKNHFYVVDPASEGLSAYWKFDEGAGISIKDYTENGNDIKAAGNLTWTEVSLPK